MNSTFPLYDTLHQQIEQDTPLTNDEVQFFIDNFIYLNDQEHEYIFALIRIYQSKILEQTNELPWGIKCIKKGLKVDIEKLPNKLQQMLYLFLKTHLKSLSK
jgi:hypothetical protein